MRFIIAIIYAIFQWLKITPRKPKGVVIKFLPGDIVLIHRGTLWQIFSPVIILFQKIIKPDLPWSMAYHVEMVWEQTDQDGYMAFSMQPPILTLTERRLSEVTITAYRYRCQPVNMAEIFYGWAGPKIHKEVYGPQGTCGYEIMDFYRKFDIEFIPFPGPIEEQCKNSGMFVRIV